jgi:hypothetical protein
MCPIHESSCDSFGKTTILVSTPNLFNDSNKKTGLGAEGEEEKARYPQPC